MAKHYHYKYGVKKSHKLRNPAIGFTLLFVLSFGIFAQIFSSYKVSGNISKALLAADSETPAVKLAAPITWPNHGYAAYAVPEDNLFAVSKDNKPVPIASLSKVITALAVLREKPLLPGEQGPIITLDKKDVALVSEYARKNGTTVSVTAGEQISQYQAMQAMLMVSSNNMADSLARWAFGSVEDYVEYANNMLQELGLNNTRVADDASGYSANTVSTAEDMAKLGYLYMKNPVLKEIAMKERATIPVAGQISNNNDFANGDGVVGIKIGNTNEAGKCFLVADIRKTKDSAEEISISVVLGAQNFDIAAKDAKKILTSGNKGHDKIKKNL